MGLIVVPQMWMDLTAEIVGPSTLRRVAAWMWKLRSSRTVRFHLIFHNSALLLTDR